MQELWRRTTDGEIQQSTTHLVQRITPAKDFRDVRKIQLWKL